MTRGKLNVSDLELLMNLPPTYQGYRDSYYGFFRLLEDTGIGKEDTTVRDAVYRTVARMLHEVPTDSKAEMFLQDYSSSLLSHFMNPPISQEYQELLKKAAQDYQNRTGKEALIIKLLTLRQEKKERTLSTYLEQVRQCDDTSTLRYDFGIYDNFEICFFGDSPQILGVLKDAFMHSPQPDGLHTTYHLALPPSTKGDYQEKLGIYSSSDCWAFMDPEKKVWVTLRAREEIYNQYLIGGLPRADVMIMLHPHPALHESCDVEGILYLKPVVIDIGELIIKKKLTAGFTHFLPGEEYDHIPK